MQSCVTFLCLPIYLGSSFQKFLYHGRISVDG